MAVRARKLKRSKSAIRYDERAAAAELQARTVRDALRVGPPAKVDLRD
jgi:hypothetical protein